MTTTSGAGPGGAGRQGDAERLHRLAAMLTGDAHDATRLTALALAGTSPSGTAETATRELVRAYLRRAPRRREGVRVGGGDAGDVLLGLSPRGRAAAVLVLVEGWAPERAAAALRTAPRRVRGLVPDVDGLAPALEGLGDRHSLLGSQLQERLGAAAVRVPPPRSRSRWRLLAGVAALALVVGYAVHDPAPGAAPQDLAAGPADGVGATPAPDLTAAGWRLSDDGDPPRRAMGLELRETVELAPGRRSTAVRVPSVSWAGYAAFAVLWCDMPPAQDRHLEVPSGTLRLGEGTVRLPCAGRDGTPAVTRVTAVPPADAGELVLSGDVPPEGGATLALYVEGEMPPTPFVRGGPAADPPPPPPGAVPVDAAATMTGVSGGGPSGSRRVQPVEVGPDSLLTIWAGRAGAVMVRVDGLPATDDGEVAGVLRAYAGLTEEDLRQGAVPDGDPRDQVDWRTQQPDVRDGTWWVHSAGELRTFSLPEPARPPAGQRRQVVVEVLGEQPADDVRVSVSDAARVPVDLAPVDAVPPGDVPEHVLGHRLLGRWDVPADGQQRELLLPEALPEDVAPVVVGHRPGGTAWWFGGADGLATRGEVTVPLWYEPDLDQLLRGLSRGWQPPMTGSGTLSVSAPASGTGATATVLAYVPVPYEEFDFDAATIPPGSWPADGPRPASEDHAMLRGWAVAARLDAEDLADGEATVGVRGGQGLGLRVTSEGRGRLRVLVDGQPAPELADRDGWWSSWTSATVTSEVEITYEVGYSREREVTVVVEDHDAVSVELLTG